VTEHKPTYSRFSRGRSAVFNRPLYGYTISCSCGWKHRTNENKRSAMEDFRWHVKEAPHV